MSVGEAAGRIIIVAGLFSFMLCAIAWGQAGYAAMFGMLFGTALERLILTAPRK